MRKRTNLEIKRDFEKISMAAKTAKTLKEIETLTGLSQSMIRTTLKKHQTTLEELKSNQENTKIKSSIDNSFATSRYVIDASVIGAYYFRDYFLRILNDNSKILLTSFTYETLQRIQTYTDVFAEDAKFILETLKCNKDSFEFIPIDEVSNRNIDSIIDYCYSHQENLVLLTANKELAMKACAISLEHHYFRQRVSDDKNRIRTLRCATWYENKLVISNFNSEISSIRVFSNGKEYNDGEKILQVGDDVYIASKKNPDYIAFIHFRIIQINNENNCEIVFSKKIYDRKAISFLSKSDYRNFLYDFYKRHDL